MSQLYKHQDLANLVENFLFDETCIMDCRYRDLQNFQSFEAR